MKTHVFFSRFPETVFFDLEKKCDCMAMKKICVFNVFQQRLIFGFEEKCSACGAMENRRFFMFSNNVHF